MNKKFLTDINLLKQYYDCAYEYLLLFKEINEETINKHLNDWKKKRAENMAQLCFTMLHHAKNRNMMPSVIGDIKRFDKILMGFDPHIILETYHSWEQIFDYIREVFGYQDSMDKNNNRSLWVIYCKAIISICEYLSKFKNVDEFHKMVDSFNIDVETRIKLPKLIGENKKTKVKGYGFALACDFLKESGYPQYVKPDTHIIKIFNELGLSNSQDVLQVFRDVTEYADTINKLPYEVDKLFWLCGSGNFYLHEKIKISTSSEEFLKYCFTSISK